MHETLRCALALAKSPTHVTPDDTRGLLKPVLATAAKLQAQVAEHRAALFNIETTPETAEHVGRFEKMHQTLNAVDDRVKVFVAAARDLNTSIAQYERYGIEIRAQLAAQGIVVTDEELTAAGAMPA